MNLRIPFNVICGCFLFCTVGANGTEPSINEARRKSALLLSDVLPTPVGQFVKRADSDRPWDTLTGDEVIALFDTSTPWDEILAVLRPKTEFEVDGPVTIRDVIAPPLLLPPGQDTQTLLAAGSQMVLGDGTEREFGSVLDAGLGNTFRNGLILNAGETTVIFETSVGDISLAPGEVLLSHCFSSCSVTCGSGYYACCNNVGSCAHCACYQSGTTTDCQAGGKGATGCSGTVVP